MERNATHSGKSQGLPPYILTDGNVVPHAHVIARREQTRPQTKGVRYQLCAAPFGPFRQLVPDPFDVRPAKAGLAKTESPRHLCAVAAASVAIPRGSLAPSRDATGAKAARGTHSPTGERVLATPGLPTALGALAAAAALALLLTPRPALADPHAVFYTDRAQEQLFFNTLAALNQADYVEPPDKPPTQSSRSIGEYVQTGILPPPRTATTRVPVRDPQTGAIIGYNRSPLEPSEQQDVELPRIRVRAVTPDDGDRYTRDLYARRALVEAQRVEMNNLLCRFLLLYKGEEGAKQCLEESERNDLPPS